MPTPPPDDKPHLQKILSALGDEASESEKRFILQFYAQLDHRICAHLAAETLIADARDARAFLADHRPGRAKVEVSTPDPEAPDPVSKIKTLVDDMPFLVDSILEYLTAGGFVIRRIVYPILTTRRTPQGQPADDDDRDAVEHRESLIYIVIDGIEDQRCESVEAQISALLGEVRLAVGDWKPMLKRVDELIETGGGRDGDDVASFLEWLRNDHFLFLGIRDFSFNGSALSAEPDSGLGLCRDPHFESLVSAKATLSAYIDLLRNDDPLLLLKADCVSRVHRAAPMDMIVVKRRNDAGEVCGETRILGLFTHYIYSCSLDAIPYIRRKVAQTLSRSGLDAGSHDGKAFMEVLEHLPRDQLLHADGDTLFTLASETMGLKNHPRIRLIGGYDALERYASLFLYVPRERYSTALRIAIGAELEEAVNGSVTSFTPSFEFGAFIRVHFLISRHDKSGSPPVLDADRLERDVFVLSRTWEDELRNRLHLEIRDSARERDLFEAYGGGFSASYKEAFAASEGVRDMLIGETLTAEAPDAFRIERNADGGEAAEADGDKEMTVVLLRLGAPAPPNQLLIMLENLDFFVHDAAHCTFTRRRRDGDVHFCRHTIRVTPHRRRDIDSNAAATPLQEGLQAIFKGACDNDRFNQLILYAGLDWRRILILRACAAYLRQLGVPYEDSYVADLLAAWPKLTADLVRLFEARMNPDGDDDGADREIRDRLERDLEAVDNIDADKTIRNVIMLIEAMTRCNHYQDERNDAFPDMIVFKFAPRLLSLVPEPRPYAEIFVYSPRLEGVHLRGGAIARGGLRWSERPNDYRTEILGLFKAQAVKNAVIVPTGAKGGFLCKRLSSAMSPQERRDEVVACYRLFINGMLSITDNLVDDVVVPPPGVRRRDGDDPYFVVAADKGTATFSDIANAISTERGFWLDDAFASGGGAGYDHKKMGITARGAWKAVERHFSELNVDIDRDGIAVAGVGDMSGDVFGNGMLLSRGIRLVAAFDHRHIFLDPDPDAAAGFEERSRLFALPSSSWDDYDRSKLGKGGAVFPRTAKTLALSPECRKLLDIDDETVSVQQCLKAILCAKVDLIWFGGIGTYIRSEDERNDDVGDRANDPIRVTAQNLRARVVGEGANLGVTQRGRIAFAERGGKINTDAIDNAAGVNCSDVEVNIKIALSKMIAENKLKRAERDALLADMTDDVAALVLTNNVLQTLGVSLAQHDQLYEASIYARIMDGLEKDGHLSRELEVLPDAATLMKRKDKGCGLSRPEISVLMAYAKNEIFRRLMNAEDLGVSTWLRRDMMNYFPAPMRDRFGEALTAHPLCREIAATLLANDIVNRCGPGFLARFDDAEAGDVEAMARAYVTARESCGVAEAMDGLDAMKTAVDAERKRALMSAETYFARHMTLWFLNLKLTSDAVESTIATYRQGYVEILAAAAAALDGEEAETFAERRDALIAGGLKADTATRLALPTSVDFGAPIIRVAAARKLSPGDVWRLHTALARRNGVARLVALAKRIHSENYFRRVALRKCLSDIETAQIRAIGDILDAEGDRDAALEAWLEAHAEAVKRFDAALGDIENASDIDLSRILALIRYLDFFSA